MADEEELYLANLDEFVNDEDKIVTYKWLSRTLSVPVNKAKQMLYAFVQKQKSQKSASHLNITYIVGGKCSVDGDIVHRYVITHDKDLEETKKTFSPVTSLHIYSVQKCRLKDSNSLYTVDFEIQQQHNGMDNRWSHICCSAAKRLADNGVHRSTHKVNGVTNDDKKCFNTKMVNGEADASRSSKGPSAMGTEQKAKASSSKAKKGQMSALEQMFAAKPSTSKTEKSDNKKSEPAQEDKEVKSNAAQTKSDSNKAGSAKSFFGKNTSVKKVSEKPAVTGKGKEAVGSKKNETLPEKQNYTVESTNEKKRELSSEDEEEPLPAKFSKAVKSDSKENKISKGDKKKGQKKEGEKKTEPTKSNKTGKKKPVISELDEEPEEKPKKRRRRMKELPKEDSSDDEETVTNAESDKKVSPDQESSRSDSSIPQQQPRQTEKDMGRRRKRKRELKSKMFMNDEGYMVTEKVWESESTDASDDELQITNPPLNEKRPSPVKKTTKKTHADMKSKGAKQASLTSFFKKS